MKNRKILLAGATGYLGRFVAYQLSEQGYSARLIVRDMLKSGFDPDEFEIIEAQVTQPDTLTGIMDGVDVVISTLGITKQKEGFTYMDVDYQANLNLLREAEKHGVKKFISSRP